MGGSLSREGLDLSDSSEYEEEDKHTDDASAYASGQQPSTSQTSSATRKTLDELDAKLQSLSQKLQVKNSAHECYRNQKGLKSCHCYKTVLKDESIVESRFMHDRFAVSDSPEAPLVVATPMKVTSFGMSAK